MFTKPTVGGKGKPVSSEEMIMRPWKPQAAPGLGRLVFSGSLLTGRRTLTDRVGWKLLLPSSLTLKGVGSQGGMPPWKARAQGDGHLSSQCRRSALGHWAGL